jgi:hypothetical protein
LEEEPSPQEKGDEEKQRYKREKLQRKGKHGSLGGLTKKDLGSEGQFGRP